MEVRILNIYKDQYIVKKQIDSSNKDDNFVKCKKGVEIYRYNSNTLCVLFLTNKYAKLRITECSAEGLSLTPFQIGDDEQTYIFPESELNTVAKICKARVKVKKDLTEEQREVLRQRMMSIREIDR